MTNTATLNTSERERDRQTDRQTYKQRETGDGQTETGEIQTDRGTDTYRQKKYRNTQRSNVTHTHHNTHTQRGVGGERTDPIINQLPTWNRTPIVMADSEVIISISGLRIASRFYVFVKLTLYKN